MPSVLKSRLSPPRRRLVELCQSINFGRVENLKVRGGEPALDDPAVVVIREIKFAGDNGPRPESARPDFALKSQVLDLLAQFDRLRDFTAVSLTVKYGLPFHMEVASPLVPETAQPAA
jgi:hypothetical protein